jgi:hypothetical protein
MVTVTERHGNFRFTPIVKFGKTSEGLLSVTATVTVTKTCYRDLLLRFVIQSTYSRTLPESSKKEVIF